MTNRASVKNIFMEILTSKFKACAFWSRIECDIVMLCADLVEPTTKDTIIQFVRQLEQIKAYMKGQGVSDDELLFIDEETKRYSDTKTISLYEEEEDWVDPEVVDTYARMGEETEGVIGIHQPYNYSQLSRLTNGVFKKTGMIKFFISREKTLYGKIVAEIYDYSQKIPIATLVESKKTNKDTGEPVYKGVKLFGERIDHNTTVVVREIPIPFFVYRFITEDNVDLILISHTQCEIGDYIITGVMTQCNDNKVLTDSAKLPTKLPFFFAQFARNRIVQYRNHKEFFGRANTVIAGNKSFYDYPFTVTIKEKKTEEKKTYKLVHPDWYKKLVWAWLVHQPKGMFNNYPLHLMVLGPMHSGKSLILNNLHDKSKESRRIFSGSSSTMKGLVPSFKSKPAELGYLAESNRFAFCDEFLRCMVNTKGGADFEREEKVAIMNDLLEHQKREAGSGVSRINVNMTARIIAVSNPVRGIQNTTDLLRSMDGSFLSRWLIYYQTNDHVNMIRNSDDSMLERYTFSMSTNDWVSLLDYLHSFSAVYDLKRVREIYDSFKDLLNEHLAKHYSARHMHHIECLIDGIVKTRCMINNDQSFKAIDEDYDDLKKVWGNVIVSWLSFEDIDKINVKDRIKYLPEKCQILYWKIVELGKPLTREEAKVIGTSLMTKGEYYEAWGILTDKGLICERDGIALPFFRIGEKCSSQEKEN